MGYNIVKPENSDAQKLACENLALCKKISILEVENSQLKVERETYKTAYEKWAYNPVSRFVRKIMGKDD